MRIRILNNNGNQKYIEDKQSIVLIGANGTGKTRMRVWIDENDRWWFHALCSKSSKKCMWRYL